MIMVWKNVLGKCKIYEWVIENSLNNEKLGKDIDMYKNKSGIINENLL